MMKLKIVDSDTNGKLCRTAVDDDGNHLFDVELVEWLSGVGRCTVKSLDSGEVYLVRGDWSMELQSSASKEGS